MTSNIGKNIPPHTSNIDNKQPDSAPKIKPSANDPLLKDVNKVGYQSISMSSPHPRSPDIKMHRINEITQAVTPQHEAQTLNDDVIVDISNTPQEAKKTSKTLPKVPENAKQTPTSESTKNTATPDFYPINQSVKILTSRSVADPKASPQSYDWASFKRNQVEFMTSWSLGEVLGVLGSAFTRTLGKETQDPKLCSNERTIISSRFLPEEVKPSDLQMETARNANTLVDITWKDSVAGAFIENTATYCGKLSLLLKAANPTSNGEVLERRGELIAQLAQNPELRGQLQQEIHTYATSETRLLNQYDPKGPGTKKPGRLEPILQPPIFKTLIPETWSEKFRKTPWLITVNDAFKTGKDLFTTASKIAAGAFTIWLSKNFIEGKYNDHLASYENLAAGTAGGVQALAQSVHSRAVVTFAGPVLGVDTISEGLTSAGYNWADAAVKRTMQHVMVDVVAPIRSMKKIYDILKDTDYINQLEHFDKLAALMENEEPEVQRMLSIVSSSTLDSKTLLGLFRAGPVFCGWDIIQGDTATEKARTDEALKAVDAEIKEAKQALKNATTDEDAKKAKADKAKAEGKKKTITERVPEVKRLILEAMIAVGEIDGILTLADTVSNANNTSSPWSVLELDNNENSQETFHVEGAHFPPIAADSPNNRQASWPSIDLAPITLITAENGAGKSTFGLNLINHILARQSLGVVPCKESSTFPIYDRVISSRGFKDSNTQSSFEITDAFVNDVMNEIKKNPDKRFFLLFDELYRDTDQNKGAARLIKLEQFLQEQHAACPNFTAIFITHCPGFANSDEVKAEKLTTKKTADGKPSGILEPGIYTFGD